MLFSSRMTKCEAFFYQCCFKKTGHDESHLYPWFCWIRLVSQWFTNCDLSNPQGVSQEVPRETDTLSRVIVDNIRFQMGLWSQNLSAWSQTWEAPLIFTKGDTLLQDESLYDRVSFQFLRGAAYFLICSWVFAKNCMIADPWKSREVWIIMITWAWN